MFRDVSSVTPGQAPLAASSAYLLGLLLLLAAVFSAPCTATAGDKSENLDDVLEGFEEEDDAFEVEDMAAPAEFDKPQFWDLTGSVSVASSVNYREHRSAAGTDYTGVQKLRTRLNLQLDLELPRDWKMRVAGYAFYDSAYRIHGRDNYTDDVLDDYEWEADSQEVYLQGRVTRNFDLKLGRQIVNWGRSDTLRVLDVLNPLDNREPGLADIEDLRLPITMARLDYYWGDWSFTAIALPEIRFDKLPPVGSDFNPAPIKLPEEEPDESFDNTEWAAAAMGIFHGWDISFHFARYWEDLPHVAPAPTPRSSLAVVQKHGRQTLVGTGGNYALGNWLLKGELAYIDGADYTVGRTLETPFGEFPVVEGTVEKSRIDFMGGVEYYGIAETTIALEVLDRHIFDFDRRMRLFDAREDAVETALRITADFFNARLRTTVLAVVFGEEAQDGSLERLSAEYELRDALTLTAGLLLFQSGDPFVFSEIGKNDRVFLEMKYSF